MATKIALVAGDQLRHDRCLSNGDYKCLLVCAVHIMHKLAQNVVLFKLFNNSQNLVILTITFLRGA